MTVIWFVVWLIADRTGDRAPLLLDPVNAWALALLLAVALDLGSHHTRTGSPVRRGAHDKVDSS